MSPALALLVSDVDGGAAGRRRFSIMVLMRIERWNLRRDGPLTDAALQQKIQALGYVTAARSYPAGTIAAAQSDARGRIQAVARGLIKITIDGESAILGPGDLVFVPEGAVRRVEAIGTAAAWCIEATKA